MDSYEQLQALEVPSDLGTTFDYDLAKRALFAEALSSGLNNTKPDFSSYVGMMQEARNSEAKDRTLRFQLDMALKRQQSDAMFNKLEMEATNAWRTAQTEQAKAESGLAQQRINLEKEKMPKELELITAQVKAANAQADRYGVTNEGFKYLVDTFLNRAKEGEDPAALEGLAAVIAGNSLPTEGRETPFSIAMKSVGGHPAVRAAAIANNLESVQPLIQSIFELDAAVESGDPKEIAIKTLRFNIADMASRLSKDKNGVLSSESEKAFEQQILMFLDKQKDVDDNVKMSILAEATQDIPGIIAQEYNNDPSEFVDSMMNKLTVKRAKKLREQIRKEERERKNPITEAYRVSRPYASPFEPKW